jgi:hypothetical protein
VNDLFDALIVHGLREQLAPKPVTDVAAAVSRALAAGRVVPLDDLPLPPVRQRCWQRFAAPVLAVAAAGVVVAVLLGRAGSNVAEADRELLVAGADGSFTVSRQFAADAVVWCTSAEPTAIAFPDGSAATARPGALFAFHRSPAAATAPTAPTVDLLAGALELRAAALPWQLHCAVADVQATTGASVTVDLTPTAPTNPDPGDPAMTLAELRSRLQSTAAVLTLTVLTGTAELATAQGKEVLAAGQSRTVSAAATAAVARATQLYAAVRAELPPPTDEAGEAAWKAMDEQYRELTNLSLQQPAAMAALRPLLRRDLAERGRSAETLGRLLALALLDEDKAMMTAATDLWTTTPELFEFEEQVALSERGFAPARAKLLEFLAQPQGALAARAAAALAFAGDASMRDVLLPWANTTIAESLGDSQKFDARCAAAVALAALGDTKAVPALRTYLRKMVEDMLQVDAVTPQAAWFVHRTAYFLASQRPRLGWFAARVDAFAGPDLGDYTDAKKVRAALDQLAPK